MQYVRDCVLYNFNISVNWDWSGIGNQLKDISINFTKYFYKFTPLRTLEDISQDLNLLEDEIKQLSLGMIDE